LIVILIFSYFQLVIDLLLYFVCEALLIMIVLSVNAAYTYFHTTWLKFVY
jgi:hypothetical protein